jgi:hypothetical protein
MSFCRYIQLLLLGSWCRSLMAVLVLKRIGLLMLIGSPLVRILNVANTRA